MGAADDIISRIRSQVDGGADLLELTLGTPDGTLVNFPPLDSTKPWLKPVGTPRGKTWTVPSVMQAIIAAIGWKIDQHINEKGGLMVSLLNDTGSASVKGELVHMSGATPFAYATATGQYDVIGAVYDDGIADGQATRIVYSGPAQVLLYDGTASILGAWVLPHATDPSRADVDQTQPSGTGFPNATEHFKEIGHSLEAQSSGVDVLSWVHLHFN